MTILVGLPNAGRCNLINPNCGPPHDPYLEEMRQFGNDWPPYGFTMTGKERLANFWSAIQEVNRNGIPGAICEFGVWRGGAMMLATAIVKQGGMKRDLSLFDAFASFGGYGPQTGFLAVQLENVQNNFRMLNLDPSEAIFVKGMFTDTTKSWIERTDPIAVLRVDGNFYYSYMEAASSCCGETGVFLWSSRSSGRVDWDCV